MEVFGEGIESSSNITFMLEVSNCGGSRLKDALNAAKHGGWGGDDTKKLGSGGKYYDEAVHVRCEEALRFYEEIEILKGWEWARWRNGEIEKEERGTVGTVRRMMGEKDTSSLKLTLNTDKLSLE